MSLYLVYLTTFLFCKMSEKRKRDTAETFFGLVIIFFCFLIFFC